METDSPTYYPMEENMNRSIAYLNKKRKQLHTELLGTPLPEHVCWDQILECDSASDTIMGQKKLKSDIFVRHVVSDQESAKDSSSFSGGGNKDTESSSNDCSSAQAHEWFEPSCSSADWADTSTEIDMCSSESSSFINPNSGKSQSFSISEHEDRLHDDYEDHLLELEGYCSECKTAGFEHCKDLEGHLLYSDGFALGNYVRSSGILPVNQDTTQLGTRKKLTIDQEFEQYFSSLML